MELGELSEPHIWRTTVRHDLVLQATLPEVKRPQCMASAFLGKCASIPAVDLIQRKKLGSRKFCKSNLAEARFESPTVLFE